jgi:hypothetical protein
MSVDARDTNTYRVMIHPTTNEVEIMSFDLGYIDASVTGRYSTINDTPAWVQERVAVLMMTDPTPPTQGVDAVGRRIDKSTYWVYHD